MLLLGLGRPLLVLLLLGLLALRRRVRSACPLDGGRGVDRGARPVVAGEVGMEDRGRRCTDIAAGQEDSARPTVEVELEV